MAHMSYYLATIGLSIILVCSSSVNSGLNMIRSVISESVEELRMENTFRFESSLSELLSCDMETAESLALVIKDAGISDPVKVEILRKNPYTVLQAEDADGTPYFINIGRGFFIMSIYKNSEDGERIYRAIR